MTSRKYKGTLSVFTGDGKGKTTAALGTALRAAGRGMEVLILQFMKGLSDLGEIHALKRCRLPVTFMQFGRPGFANSRVCEPLDIHIAQQGFKTFREAMASGDYDMIILDEINIAISFGLLKVEEVLEAIRHRPPRLHLVMTGRNADVALIEMADLVTEMSDVKHPFHKGIKGEKGIEF